MVGFVRQRAFARGYGLPLEATAVVLERGDLRVVACAVDVLGLVYDEANVLIDHIVDRVGASPDGVLLNWSHTHLAPRASHVHHGSFLGDVDADQLAAVHAFERVIQDKIVTACELAAARLEPATVVWGQADVDLSVNRRERTTDGSNGGTKLGWNPDELIDNQVTVLQARRPDETAIATVVGYGCHPVTTGFDMDIYSADFVGPLRSLVRNVTGGECVYLQGAGGNVLPKFAFTDSEAEAVRMGSRIGLAAVESVADEFGTPVTVVSEDEESAHAITRYRLTRQRSAVPALAALREVVTIPLLRPLPRLEDVRELLVGYDAELEAAKASGDNGRIRVALFHQLWASRTEAALEAGTAETEVQTSINAIRIGDGAIVTGPGESFTEYSIAVKERSPARPTMYAGYTNDLVGYLPTAREYEFGGFEAGYGFKSNGLPALFDPSVEEICVKTGVRLVERLFPDAQAWDDSAGWTAAGNPPALQRTRLDHPSQLELGARG